MILRQFLHTTPTVAASYLVGCGGKGVSAVIDPLGDVDLYLRASEEHGMTIRYVIDTHVHADHLSVGRSLAEAAGAQYVLGPGVDPAFPVTTVRDGEELELGNVVIRVVHTPGHTPEHISLLVIDRTRGPEPWCVFTGHTLMVGDMGVQNSRPIRERAIPARATRLRKRVSGSVFGLGVWPGIERQPRLLDRLRAAIQ